MRFVFSLFLLLVMANAGYPQKQLTLDDAVNIALQRNSTLQKNINAIKSYESDLLASYGSLIPSLSATGNWGWSRSEDEGGSLNIAGFVIPLPATTTESRNYSASVNASWTLFDGLANFASISQSKNNLESAKLSLERLKQGIIFQTTQFYYDVINAQQLLKVREDNLKWNQKSLETITERNRLGAVTLADVYAQQVRTGNAELEVIRAKNNLETSKANLLFFLGLEVTEDFSFPDALSAQELLQLEADLAEEYENLTGLINRAYDNRKDYISAQFELESALEGITIARSGHFPRLTNSISYSLRSNEFKRLTDSRTYSVGLTLSIPIFSGFSVSNRVQLAEVNAWNKKIELSDLEREIKKDLKKTNLDLQAAGLAVNLSEKNVKAAEENLKIEEEKYSLGAGTLLNVLIANSEYTSALTNYINAQFSFIVFSEQLKYYLGVLGKFNYE